MYGVQLATITNFAVLGDGLQIYLYLQTAWWADGQGQWGLVCLVAWMLLTKLVKLIPWLWRYPADIVFLPGLPRLRILPLVDQAARLAHILEPGVGGEGP
ncbi:glycosyltransferase family 2 protein [Apiospora arundinis]